LKSDDSVKTLVKQFD